MHPPHLSLLTPGHSPPVHAPQPLIALQAPKPDSPDTLGGWLRGIIDKPKFAVFEAKVLIEELGNVPQMQGRFQAEWKFRGRAVHGKETPHLTPKPSLPNIKLNQATPNDSSVSLHSNRSSAESSVKSFGLPSSLSISPATSLPPSPRTAKRGSEPTPLRQSTKPDPAEMPRSTSPELMTPTEILAGRDRKHSLDSERTENSSPGSSVLFFGKPSKEATVPTPRSVPPVRSGTIPSASTLLDPVPGRDDYPLLRPFISRTLTSRSVELPQPSRPRILSGAHKRPPDPSGSSHRKGSTPAHSLHRYTCEWQYTVQHTIKIPFGRSVSASGAATPNRRETAPILGGGASSESGLSLHIYEIPTRATTTAKDPAEEFKQGANKILYGTVDVDLAAFAGRGKVSRRFLLKQCKTNATVKLTVEMRQVGGDMHWAAPPMVEGHHVTGVRDLVGEEALHDLSLARNSSGSSSGSSPANSAAHSVTSLIPNRSNPSLVPRPEIHYDHHLKPSDAQRPPPLSRLNTQIETPLSSATIREPVVTHRKSDRSLKGPPGHRKHHHHRHLHHKGVGELAPEVIIEAIFNPHPSSEEGPMTYVPRRMSGELEPEAVVLHNMEEDEKIDVDVEDGEKGVWQRMRKRAQVRSVSAKVK